VQNYYFTSTPVDQDVTRKVTKSQQNPHNRSAASTVKHMVFVL